MLLLVMTLPLLMLPLMIGGCAEPPTLDSGTRDTAGPLDETAGPDGLRTTCIDASAEEAWVPYDLDGAASVEAGWDLGFQRYHIRVNGGVSGDAGVEVAWTEGLALEAATQAPAEGWFSDAEDADGDGVPEYAFGDWYDYDASTHSLSPKDRIWFLRSGEGAVFKLEVLDYYDEHGTGGHPCLRWGALEAAG